MLVDTTRPDLEVSGVTPRFDGRPTSQRLVDALASSIGDTVTCWGLVAAAYDGEAYYVGMPWVGASEGLGEATAYLDGYLWLLLGDCKRFTFLVLSDTPATGRSSYAGYTVATRIDGQASYTFEVRVQNGISWTWLLTMYELGVSPAAEGLSPVSVRPAVAAGGLILLGTGTMKAESSLFHEPNGDVWYIYQSASYEVRDASGNVVASRLAPERCQWGQPACQETIVTARCDYLGNAFSYGPENTLRQAAADQALDRLLEQDLAPRHLAELPAAATIGHAVYLLMHCEPLRTCLASWYTARCEGVGWDEGGLTPRDGPDAGDVLGA